MKSPLHADADKAETSDTIKNAVLARDIAAAKRGDWKAKHRIEVTLTPLLTDLAKKRVSSNSEINALMDAGKLGIEKAIKKFKPDTGADRFPIFALRFIEDKMDNPNSGGFFSKLFGS